MTNDLEKRIWQNETGFSPDSYTFKRRPVKLHWHTIVETIDEAMQLEKQIKGWSRKKKEAMIKGDINELKRLSNEKKNISHRPSLSSGVNVIIIGQGITGTFLSYYLQKNNLSFIIIDESKTNTASKAAAGIINPITGRRIVKTWMIDELMNFAKSSYHQIENELNINCISETKIIDFFPTPQMRNSFLERFEDNSEYLKLPSTENDQRENLNYDFGYGEIHPVLLININELLLTFRKKLLNDNFLIEEHFDITELKVSENKIQYKNITADKIIFCDGIESCSNPYFKNLPFAPNKGEALIAEINEFPSNYILKKGINIVPWKENLFWIGSSYQWKFNDDKPTESFRKQTESILRNWIKTDFKIIEHFASVRPATLERRPFVGFHPIYKNVGILNGMGTKGCSLAPFFADQLVDHIVNSSPLNADANINRFDKILSRK